VDRENALQEHVFKAVDEFCEARISEDRIKNWCVGGGVPHADYNAFYESDLGAYCLPPQIGGWEGPFIARALLVARLTRRAGAVLPYQTDMVAMALLSTMRSLSQQEIVEDLVARNGRVVFSQAFSEGDAQGDSAEIETRVVKSGGGIFLDGAKTYVANGQFFPEALVLAHDDVYGADDGGMSLWLVPLKEEGVYTYPLDTIGQEMLALARVEFDHVKLNEDWRIQTEGMLGTMLERQYELSRILTCSASLGLAQAAMDDAIERCAGKHVEGRILGSIPQIETKLADMAAKIRSMRAMIETAADSVSSGASLEKRQLDCSLMKYYVPRTATEVANDALQIFGGAGYTNDSRVSRIWRDCRGNQLAQGADEMMVHGIAERLLETNSGILQDY
jgi:alkylation response protein AidB-like acyl-CoA dehydrogenase